MAWDTRHNLNFIANYKFDSRDPYNKGIPKFLRDFTVNFDFNLRSGTPFTQQTAATPEVIHEYYRKSRKPRRYQFRKSYLGDL
jgi:hypothetical protein